MTDTEIEVNNVLLAFRFFQEERKTVDSSFFDIVQTRLMQDFMIEVSEYASRENVSFAVAFEQLGNSELRLNHEKMVRFGASV